jgi:acyl-CoA synthetase (AMP-forming)/AMP-acid ligase II
VTGFSYRDWSQAGWRTHAPGLDAAGLGDTTILDLAAESAARFPDRVAVRVDGSAITHAELLDASERVAGFLSARIAPGDRVLLAAGASLGFVRCYLGALRAGAVVVLANPGYTGPELAHLVRDSGAVLAFADRPRAVPGVPVLDINAIPASGPRSETVVSRPNDIAILAYTSGTTGKPKGVPLSHRRLALSIRSAMAAWRWTPEDVLVHALPLFHQHGLGGLHTALISGGSTHILSRFDPGSLGEAIRRSGASVLFGVPTIYQTLLDHGVAIPGLRLAVCGSAPLSPALAERLPSVLGRLPLVRYGTTETGLNVSNPVAGPRGDTIGVPLPGVLIRLCEPAGSTEVAPGSDGEIQVRGPQVFGGYWNAADAAAFTSDGWFRTGDIGTVGAHGHLVIRGRIKEMIITGGLNVYPREVEIALETHPSVLEAAVTGIPHERWGEQVTAWVVPRAGHAIDEAELIAYARTMLAAYKCPKQVFRVDALPRNHMGKLDRAKLDRAKLDRAKLDRAKLARAKLARAKLSR